MSGEGQDKAIDRIDRALARIESAAAAPRASTKDSDLTLRHARLRARVEEAIASLDALIAEADED